MFILFFHKVRFDYGHHQYLAAIQITDTRRSPNRRLHNRQPWRWHQQRHIEGWNEYQGSGRNDHAREKALIEDRVVKVEVPVMAVYEAEI